MTLRIRHQNFLSKAITGKPRLSFSSSGLESVNNIAMDFFFKKKKKIISSYLRHVFPKTANQKLTESL